MKSSTQSSSSGPSIPVKDVRQTSNEAVERGIDLVAIRTAASPTARRDDLLDSPIMVFPDTDTVGSMRTAIMVYSSRNTGYLRGPPRNAEASGYNIILISYPIRLFNCFGIQSSMIRIEDGFLNLKQTYFLHSAERVLIFTLLQWSEPRYKIVYVYCDLTYR